MAFKEPYMLLPDFLFGTQKEVDGRTRSICAAAVKAGNWKSVEATVDILHTPGNLLLSNEWLFSTNKQWMLFSLLKQLQRRCIDSKSWPWTEGSALMARTIEAGLEQDWFVLCMQAADRFWLPGTPASQPIRADLARKTLLRTLEIWPVLRDISPRFSVGNDALPVPWPIWASGVARFLNDLAVPPEEIGRFWREVPPDEADKFVRQLVDT